ncbi:unnamed protein product, partial [Laminaria digitata]
HGQPASCRARPVSIDDGLEGIMWIRGLEGRPRRQPLSHRSSSQLLADTPVVNVPLSSWRTTLRIFLPSERPRDILAHITQKPCDDRPSISRQN